jgi:hypothetical protein
MTNRMQKKHHASILSKSSENLENRNFKNGGGAGKLSSQ